MPTLHLGVIDSPYGNPPKASKKGRKSKLKSSSVLTTGDVADILEAKYHPMEIFFTVKEKQIVAALEDSVSGALESVLMGGPASLDPFGTATNKIEELFRSFLEKREMERLGYPGVPSKAALAGVNHRLLHPNAKANPRRPTFIDTGAYQTSFKAWID